MGHTYIIRKKASKLKKRVLLPEAEVDDRVLIAASVMSENQLGVPVLLGTEKKIAERCKGKDINLPSAIEILPVEDPAKKNEKFKYFKQKLAHKNPSDEQIWQMCRNSLFTAGWMLEKGVADVVVAGSIAPTPDVIRAALRTVGISEQSALVSSSFLMELPDGRTFTYADCAVVPYPDSSQLASIAIDAAFTHRKLTGEDPLIAFLSFSTLGSAKHERVELVKEAVQIAQKKQPGWTMDGELQFDTAFLPEVARRKAPDSPSAGKASVYIFPNLDAGNIAYKITERLAGAIATGPILQGLNKPFMDLSRGCSVDDIVNAACVGILMGQQE